jgi:TPR repeat protein
MCIKKALFICQFVGALLMWRIVISIVCLFSLFTESRASLNRGLDLFVNEDYQGCANIFTPLIDRGAIIPIQFLGFMKKNRLAVITKDIPSIPASEQNKCQMYLDSTLAYQRCLQNKDFINSMMQLVRIANKGHVRAFFLHAQVLEKARTKKYFSPNTLSKRKTSEVKIGYSDMANCFDADTIINIVPIYNADPDGHVPGADQFISSYKKDASTCAQVAFDVGRSLEKENDKENDRELIAYWMRVALENGHPEAQFYVAKYLSPLCVPSVDESNAEFLNPNAKNKTVKKKSKKKDDQTDKREAIYPYIRYLISRMPENNSIEPIELGKIFDLHVTLLRKEGANDEILHKYSKKSADNGFFVQQCHTAARFWRGVGCGVDKQKALEYSRKANAQGCLRGKFYTAICLLADAAIDGSDAEARELFKELVMKGHVASLALYGGMLRDGRGGPQNPQEALSHIQKAAELGDINGELTFAECHNFGLLGCSNRGTAAEYYRRAANKGDMEGQYRYAILLDELLGGNKKNVYKYFKRAADQKIGHALAKLECAIMLRNGEGVEQDPEASQKYLEESIALGCLEAKVCQHKWNVMDNNSAEDTSDKQQQTLQIDLEIPAINEAESVPDEKKAPVNEVGSDMLISTTPPITTAVTISGATTEFESVNPADKEVADENEKYMKLLQMQNFEFKEKKQQHRLYLAVEKNAYESIDKMKAHFTPMKRSIIEDLETTKANLTPLKRHMVKEPDTITFVEAVCGVGDKKFGSFTTIGALKAFEDLGFTLKKVSGKNAIELSMTLTKGVDVNLIYDADEDELVVDNEQNTEKLTIHNIHGKSKDKSLNPNQQRYFKRLLEHTNRTAGEIELKSEYDRV